MKINLLIFIFLFVFYSFSQEAHFIPSSLQDSVLKYDLLLDISVRTSKSLQNNDFNEENVKR